MKSPILILSCLILFSLGCASQKDYIAEFDFNYSGNFKKYKTFGFVNNPFPDSLDYYTAIERSISTRLGSQGFKLNDSKPDILINYKLFTDNVKYRGYDQPNFDFWLQRKPDSYIELTEEEEKENREKDENYNRVKYMENNGMLVIFVIDNKKGSTIWQGYTSAYFDLMDPEVTTELTKATYRVMDKFRLVTKN